MSKFITVEFISPEWEKLSDEERERERQRACKELQAQLVWLLSERERTGHFRGAIVSIRDSLINPLSGGDSLQAKR